jgi:hypothetical protein
VLDDVAVDGCHTIYSVACSNGQVGHAHKPAMADASAVRQHKTRGNRKQHSHEIMRLNRAKSRLPRLPNLKACMTQPKQ